MQVNEPVTEFWFKEKKYLSVKELVPNYVSQIFEKKYLEKARNNEGTKDPQCPLSNAWYSQPDFEALMVQCQPAIEHFTGLKLFPTYTYARVYNSGEILEKHRDRPSCEISVTLNLGQSSKNIWPIWIEGKEGPIEIPLSVGDAMIYRGGEVLHWREKFKPEKEDDYQVQVFMHYVDQNGSFSSYKFDGRPHLVCEKYL